MTIQLLPPQLANQIAAGEVVERPASVVKELVENALDSGATKIEIDIEKGGHKKITVRDNGKGIAKEQLKLALARHATSKISTFEDLEAIHSLGFRGEALASISSVSRLTISSKPKTQTGAWSACAEGIEMAVVEKPCAHPDGTSVEVLDLFFNTPGRRKFLRAEKTEFTHIEVLIKRIALSCPHITFILKHNAKTVHRFRAFDKSKLVEDMNMDVAAHRDRIAQVVGHNFIEHASVVQQEYDDVRIEVWVKAPETCGSTNPAQYSFVNGRMMRDKLIQHAIRQAYADNLHSEQLPEYVVYIDLPANQVDVNVHPAKHEVRFHHARLLHDLLLKCMTDALDYFLRPSGHQEQNQFESPDFIQMPTQSLAQSDTKPRKPITQEKSYRQELKPAQYHYVRDNQHSARTIDYERLVPNPIPTETSLSAGTVDIQVNEEANRKTNSLSYQIVFKQQLDYWYLSFAGDDRLWVVDINALLLNKNQQTSVDLNMEPTPLLVPVRLRLNESELAWCNSYLTKLSEYGFDTILHSGCLIVKQVPNALRQQSNNGIVERFFTSLMAAGSADFIMDVLTSVKHENNKESLITEALESLLTSEVEIEGRFPFIIEVNPQHILQGEREQ